MRSVINIAEFRPTPTTASYTSSPTAPPLALGPRLDLPTTPTPAPTPNISGQLRSRSRPARHTTTAVPRLPEPAPADPFLLNSQLSTSNFQPSPAFLIILFSSVIFAKCELLTNIFPATAYDTLAARPIRRAAQGWSYPRRGMLHPRYSRFFHK